MDNIWALFDGEKAICGVKIHRLTLLISHCDTVWLYITQPTAPHGLVTSWLTMPHGLITFQPTPLQNLITFQPPIPESLITS